MEAVSFDLLGISVGEEVCFGNTKNYEFDNHVSRRYTYEIKMEKTHSTCYACIDS